MPILDLNGSELASAGNDTTWDVQLALFGCDGSLTYQGSLILYFSEAGGDTVLGFPSSDTSSSLSVAVIFGIVIAIVIFIVVLVGIYIAYFYSRMCFRPSMSQGPNSSAELQVQPQQQTQPAHVRHIRRQPSIRAPVDAPAGLTTPLPTQSMSSISAGTNV